MNPRAMYRWKSFWLGLLVVAGLGWAWARSMDRDEAVSIHGPGAARFEARICVGVAGACEWEGEMDYTRREVSGYSRKASMEQELMWRRWAFLLKEEERGSFWWVAFPMWFPFVVSLTLWAGWLAWRWKRVKGIEANIEHRTPNIE